MVAEVVDRSGQSKPRVQRPGDQGQGAMGVVDVVEVREESHGLLMEYIYDKNKYYILPLGGTSTGTVQRGYGKTVNCHSSAHDRCFMHRLLVLVPAAPPVILAHRRMNSDCSQDPWQRSVLSFQLQGALLAPCGSWVRLELAAGASSTM